MFKKIISLFIVLSLVLGISAITPSFVFAEDDERPEEADFIESLGIMEYIEGASYSANVTREDFAFYTASISKLPTEGNDSVRKFIDVPTDCYAFTSINTLVKAGVISQNNEGTFRPKDYITYGEAYTMLLNLLGYKDTANAYAPWPMGYLTIAKELGLFCGDCYDKITLADAYKLIFKALQVPIYKISEINQYGNKYDSNDEDTLLFINYGMKTGEGEVTSVFGATISSRDVSRKKKITISGKKLTVDDSFDEAPFFATYVKYFYYDESGKICYMQKKKGADDKVIDIKDLDGYRNGKFYFYENETDKKSKTEDVSSDAVIVYNGMPISTDVSDTLSNLNKGTITYKDSNGDKEYDTIVIYDFRNFVVLSNDSANKIVYSKLNKDTIDFGSCDYYKILVGEKQIETDDLVVNVVLSYAMSQDNKMVLAYANSMSLEGEIESICDDEVYVNGVLYGIDNDYIDEFKSKTEVGGTYTFHMDDFGNICYISKVGKTKMTFGYLIKAVDNGNDISQKLTLKLLTADNKIEFIPVAKKVKIDGIEYKSTKDELKCFSDKDGNVIRQLIQYELNSNNEIIDIDTLTETGKEDPDYSLRKVFKGNPSAAWWIQGSRYEMKGIFSANTLGFMVPGEDDADDKYYSVGTWSKAVGTTAEKTGAFDVYYRSANSAYVDVLIKVTSGLTVVSERNVVMLTSSGVGMDSDGDTVKVLTGFDSSGSSITIKVDEDKCPSNLKNGDLVSVAVYENGETAEVLKVYDGKVGGEPTGFAYDDGEYLLLVRGEWSHNYRSGAQISFGFAKKTFDDGIVSWSRYFAGEETERAIVPAKVAVYDSKLDKVYAGTIGDINGYDDIGDNCSKIFYHTYLGLGRGMFVYR